MGFTKAADATEIPAGSMKKVTVDGKDLLIANVEGGFYAISNVCTHARGSLSEGKLEGNIVTCPKHGSKFDFTTGKSVRGPKIAFIQLKTGDVPRFEVKLEGTSILVKTQ